MADYRTVSPRYFTSMSIPVVSGRDVAWSDTRATPLVVVISETAARMFWPNQDALGKRLKLGRADSQAPWLTVVGVVGDVRQLDVLRVPRPAVYFPASQDQGVGDTLSDWTMHTSADPIALVPAVREAIWSVDAGLPITRVQTMGAIRRAATASQQFTLVLVGLFAVLALVLAAIGVYGVMAYNVAQRTRELAIRVTLGASRRELLKLVLGHAIRLTLIGVGVGVVMALTLTDFIATLLFGVGPRDPMTLAGVALLLILVSLVASIGPVHRALRLDPAAALRA
jgi:predicted permease